MTTSVVWLHLSYSRLTPAWRFAHESIRPFGREWQSRVRIGDESSWIGHFRVTLCLCFKRDLRAKPFLWKWVLFAWKWTCRPNTFTYEWIWFLKLIFNAVIKLFIHSLTHSLIHSFIRSFVRSFVRFAWGLVLIQRQKATGQWPILSLVVRASTARKENGDSAAKKKHSLTFPASYAGYVNALLTSVFITL